MADELNLVSRKYDFGRIYYYLARIQTALGEKEGAVNFLRRSPDQGGRYYYDRFEHDIYLRDLQGYAPYEELIRSDQE